MKARWVEVLVEVEVEARAERKGMEMRTKTSLRRC
jgi:hypothetical protein